MVSDSICHGKTANTRRRDFVAYDTTGASVGDAVGATGASVGDAVGATGASVGDAVGEATVGAATTVGAPLVGAGVLTGLNALWANTLLGRLTDRITGAAHAAWMTSRLVIPSPFFS